MLGRAGRVALLVALVVGLALTLAVALTLGFITLRMKGHYLPLATIAWGISLYFLFGNLEFLGGHTGMTGIPSLGFFGVELRDVDARTVLGRLEAALRSLAGFFQLLAESLILSVIGGIAGMLIAVWGLDVLLAVAPSNRQRW